MTVDSVARINSVDDDLGWVSGGRERGQRCDKKPNHDREANDNFFHGRECSKN